MAEDAERDKGKLMKENAELTEKIKTLTSTSKVNQMIEKVLEDHERELNTGNGRGIIDSK